MDGLEATNQALKMLVKVGGETVKPFSADVEDASCLAGVAEMIFLYVLIFSL